MWLCKQQLGSVENSSLSAEFSQHLNWYQEGFCFFLFSTTWLTLIAAFIAPIDVPAIISKMFSFTLFWLLRLSEICSYKTLYTPASYGEHVEWVLPNFCRAQALKQEERLPAHRLNSIAGWLHATANPHGIARALFPLLCMPYPCEDLFSLCPFWSFSMEGRCYSSRRTAW